MKRTDTAAAPLVLGLAGNPNVGKSTLFNALTGLRQHTGNWTGKTVASARGTARLNGREITLVDTPGAYSLTPMSEEESVTREFVLSNEADVMVVLCDGGCLERTLPLALQIMALFPRVVVVVNLLDEAKKHGITLDLPRLSSLLGVPVVGTSARSGHGVQKVLETAVSLSLAPAAGPVPLIKAPEESEAAACARRARALCRETVIGTASLARRCAWDKAITGRALGLPLLLLLLCLVFYLTLQGANYPSALLQKGFAWLEAQLSSLLFVWGAPLWLRSALTEGMLRVTGWVISVMLPPMAIFFPLFTLLEDLGYLPRVAFSLDAAFARCHACGKQALTICMGCGCNAAGVVGCRIIDSRRERLMAILTNSITPCNGRLPAMTALLTLFFAGSGLWGSLTPALLMGLLLAFSLGMSLLSSRFLSATVLRGLPSSYTLELPPFRRPQVGRVLLRSLLDRTLHVLGRAAAVAAPCGLLVWGLCRLPWDGGSLYAAMTRSLEPIGAFFGLDGVVLCAFILGLPANEIVLPLVLMGYLSAGSLAEPASLEAMGTILRSQGWTQATALCFLLFSMLHWPCSTTLLTIKKETGSWGWTALSALLPTLLGLGACLLVRLLSGLF